MEAQEDEQLTGYHASTAVQPGATSSANAPTGFGGGRAGGRAGARGTNAAVAAAAAEAAAAGAAAEGETAVALQEAHEAITSRDAELGLLRRVVQVLRQRLSVDGPSASGQPSARASPTGRAGHVAMRHAVGTWGGGANSSLHPQLQRGRPAALMMDQGLAPEGSGLTDAALMSRMPSPLPELPSVPSGASFWLGSAATAATAAAGGAHSPDPTRLRSSYEEHQGLSRLLRSSLEERQGPLPLLGSPHAGVTSDTGDAGGAMPASPDTELGMLRAALLNADVQNERLRVIVAAMRTEMETLQHQQNGQHMHTQPLQQQQQQQGAEPIPADAAVLVAELAASDEELRHALEHVAVLQAQLLRQSGGEWQQQEQQLQVDEVAYLRRVRLHFECANCAE